MVYTYDAANQLTNVGGIDYKYDAAGNLIDNGTYLFTYNADNRLIQVNNKSTNALLASYTYDDQGRRDSKTTLNGTSYYHYDQNDNVVYVSDSTGVITTDYTWDDHGRPVTMTQNGITYYYHLNGHGDVTAITDNNGNVVASYQYDAWGNVTAKSGSMADANPYRYAGYRYDEIMGMYYLINRMYDPTIGRFIQRDWPHEFENISLTFRNSLMLKDEHIPLLQNDYLYTHNNPILFIDPYGHSSYPAYLSRQSAPKNYNLVYQNRDRRLGVILGGLVVGTLGLFNLPLGLAMLVAGTAVSSYETYRGSLSYKVYVKKSDKKGFKYKVKTVYYSKLNFKGSIKVSYSYEK